MTPEEVFAAAAQAALALPTAIKDSLDLLRNRKPTSSELEAQFKTIRDHIAGFCEFHRWLRAAKTFHDKLTLLDAAFDPAYAAVHVYSTAGRLEPETVDVKHVRVTWEIVKRRPLEELIAGARSESFVDDTALLVDANGQFVSGPAWASTVLHQAHEIDCALDKINKGHAKARIDLCNAVSAFGSAIRTQLVVANESIRKRATELADLASRLQGALRGV